MRHIDVRGCNNCPFLHAEYDWDEGDEPLYTCVLLNFGRTNYFSNTIGYKTVSKYYVDGTELSPCDIEYVPITPEWCPLIDETRVVINYEQTIIEK